MFGQINELHRNEISWRRNDTADGAVQEKRWLFKEIKSCEESLVAECTAKKTLLG